jgi:hypothetical protein
MEESGLPRTQNEQRRGEVEVEYLGMSLGSRVLYVVGVGVGNALLRCSLQYNFENK